MGQPRKVSKRQRSFASLAFRAVDDISVRLGDDGYISAMEITVLDQALDAVIFGNRCWPRIARIAWQVIGSVKMDHQMLTDEDKTAIRKLRARIVRIARKLNHPDLAEVLQASKA